MATHQVLPWQQGEAVFALVAGTARRWWSKPRGPVVVADCPSCGESFRARGLFDLKHYEDVDGVACGAAGVFVSMDGRS